MHLWNLSSMMLRPLLWYFEFYVTILWLSFEFGNKKCMKEIQANSEAPKCFWTSNSAYIPGSIGWFIVMTENAVFSRIWMNIRWHIFKIWEFLCNSINTLSLQEILFENNSLEINENKGNPILSVYGNIFPVHADILKCATYCSCIIFSYISLFPFPHLWFGKNTMCPSLEVTSCTLQTFLCCGVYILRFLFWRLLYNLSTLISY